VIEAEGELSVRRISLGDVADRRRTHGIEHERLSAGRITQRLNRIIDPEDVPLCGLARLVGALAGVRPIRDGQPAVGSGENEWMAGSVAG
jgi:hypothetical protein